MLACVGTAAVKQIGWWTPSKQALRAAARIFLDKIWKKFPVLLMEFGTSTCRHT